VAFLSFTRVAIVEAQRAAADRGSAYLLGSPNFVGTIDAFVRRYIFEPFKELIVEEAPSPQIFERQSRTPDIIADLANKLFDAGARRPYGPWSIVARLGDRGLERWYDSGSGHLTDVSTVFSEEQVLSAKREMLQRGFATFNDITMWSWWLLCQEPARIGEIVSRRFRQIIIDEAQDTSRLQQAIIAHLHNCGSGVTCAGDLLQAVYGFNGADPEFLTRDQWSDQLQLSTTFRCRASIVSVINATYNDAMSSAGVTMRSVSRNVDGIGETLVLVGSAEECLDQFLHYATGAGLDDSECAILVRGNDLRSALRGYVHPKKAQSKAVTATLWAIQYEMSGRVEDAARSMLKGMEAVIAIDSRARADREKWLSEAWMLLRTRMAMSGGDNVDGWLAKVRKAFEEFAGQRGLQLRGKLSQLVTKRGIADESTLWRPGASDRSVRVDTVHGAKGESIPAVLLIGTQSQHRSWLAGRTNEEGLIGYVGLSRAEKLLAIGCPDKEIADQWAFRMRSGPSTRGPL